MFNFSWFERLSIIVILINCISLGLYDPCQNKGGSDCHSTKEMFRKILNNNQVIKIACHKGFTRVTARPSPPENLGRDGPASPPEIRAGTARPSMSSLRFTTLGFIFLKTQA